MVGSPWVKAEGGCVRRSVSAAGARGDSTARRPGGPFPISSDPLAREARGSPRRCRTSILVGIATVAALLIGGSARAAGRPPAGCLAAYKEAEELAKTQRLRRAKALMLSCAKPVCGV